MGKKSARQLRYKFLFTQKFALGCYSSNFERLGGKNNELLEGVLYSELSFIFSKGAGLVIIIIKRFG
jgi:hypothetical protein